MKHQKSIYFFGTKADIEPGLQRIEACCRLQYLLDEYHDTKEVPRFYSVFELPHFGKVQQRLTERYIVIPREHKVKINRIVQLLKGASKSKFKMALAMIGVKPLGGVVRYEVSHIGNPSSIVFGPGGWYSEKILVSGEIGTILETKDSLELFKLFKKELLKGFTKVKSFYVGAEALHHLKIGVRLTMDVEAAPTIDLRL